jgi:hypothetical protein
LGAAGSAATLVVTLYGSLIALRSSGAFLTTFISPRRKEEIVLVSFLFCCYLERCVDHCCCIFLEVSLRWCLTWMPWRSHYRTHMEHQPVRMSLSCRLPKGPRCKRLETGICLEVQISEVRVDDVAVSRLDCGLRIPAITNPCRNVFGLNKRTRCQRLMTRDDR